MAASQTSRAASKSATESLQTDLFVDPTRIAIPKFREPIFTGIDASLSISWWSGSLIGWAGRLSR
jgi:hypothetical protein